MVEKRQFLSDFAIRLMISQKRGKLKKLINGGRMLKKFFYVSLIASAFLFGNFDTNAEPATAANYFKTEVIAGISYLFEFTHDGILVNVTVIED